MNIKTLLRPLVALASAMFAVGCLGGDDSAASVGDGGTEVTAQSSDAQEARVCGAHTTWEKKCATDADPVDESWGETECRQGPWRYAKPAYVEATAKCLDSLPCGESDDNCTSAGFEAIGVNENSVKDDPVYKKCIELADTCPELIDDACLVFFVFNDAARAAATKCLDKPCAEIEACVDLPDAQ